MGQQTSPSPLSPVNTVVVPVATVKTHASSIVGKVGGINSEILLDSGSSVSLLSQELTQKLPSTESRPLPQVLLQTASGDPMAIIDCVSTVVWLPGMNKDIVHTFIVVKDLIAPAIIGVDFFQQHKLTVDFSKGSIHIYSLPQSTVSDDLQHIWQAAVKHKPPVNCVAATLDASDVTIDCAIPDYGAKQQFDLPYCESAEFSAVVSEYQDLFSTTPGYTSLAYHYIPTQGPPIRVPPRRVPAHYRTEVERQIQQMLEQGVITESSSPWMAPAVFVPKKSGELRICIDYRQLNKQTVKDAYPLPLPDEVQDRLAGCMVFTTLDLHSGYWQLPVAPHDQLKTAFCPGPGMGLYQFCRMPFGLTGAPGSFQRLMDSVSRGLPFVMTYLDDLLIYSPTPQAHEQHLRQVFQRLRDAGLTLRGTKCHIGLPQVSYLGHIFDGKGMHPDPSKVDSIHQWPPPSNVTALKQFLGLASYYRRYIKGFADIAAPLHHLTKKSASFSWTKDCDQAFSLLKSMLIQAPILAFPNFTSAAAPFLLQTDASAVGLGAVLEQGGRVIAYASRTLSSAEQQYSTIQKECLAAVFALKQFRHYLLGRSFQLLTDHAPLQWLSAQKMEGLLCRWALAMQEYSFQIVYRKGSLHANADALSRSPLHTSSKSAAMTSLHNLTVCMKDAQQSDRVFLQIYQMLLSSPDKPPKDPVWKQSPLRRYAQLWHQLCIVDDVICRTYCPSPASDCVTVPLVPPSLRQHSLKEAHDIPSAGHQGYLKTLSRLQQQAYWAGMASDVQQYCQQCNKCQMSKLPSPTQAPLQNVPIGNPWEMLAVDILEVPISRKNHRYLLVIMDYFTKWVDAVPLRDQTAVSVSDAIINLCSNFGIPTVIHSDQGRNFESSLFSQVLQAFGIQKSRTTAYHPQGDGMVERFNRSILQMLRCYVDQEDDWERYLPLVLYAYRTAQHSSTGLSPFQLMFGRRSQPAPFKPPTAFDPNAYSAQLQAKLAHLQDLVQSNLAAAAQNQKLHYDKHSKMRAFQPGDPVWLSVTTRGKLHPRWEGKWSVVEVKTPINLHITNGKSSKVVHTNRVRHRIIPQTDSTLSTQGHSSSWYPPQVTHHVIDSGPESSRYPQRNRRPPNWFRP